MLTGGHLAGRFLHTTRRPLPGRGPWQARSLEISPVCVPRAHARVRGPAAPPGIGRDPSAGLKARTGTRDSPRVASPAARLAGAAVLGVNSKPPRPIRGLAEVRGFVTDLVTDLH